MENYFKTFTFNIVEPIELYRRKIDYRFTGRLEDKLYW